MRGCRGGWTLFELLLVMAVLVMVAAIVSPSLESMYADVRLRGAADAIRAAWARARASAVNQGTAYRFSVIPNSGNYRIAPDNADAAGGKAGANGADPDNQPFVLEDVLPKGVSIGFSAAPSAAGSNGPASGSPAGTADVGQYVSAAVFLPDGTARDDVRLLLTTRGARPLVMNLRALTGGVTTKRLNPNRQRP